MSEKYVPQEIEPRWQQKWEADKLHRAVVDQSKPKHYAMTMYPYPSGDLHMGHWYAMAPSDARARYMRMKGYNVLFPMGFDSFGLPAENAAIKHHIHPKKWTYDNIDRMRTQLRSMGAMFDWEREAVTSDPEYYKWSEWFFLKFYENDLAYRKLSPVDFCPHCNTTLAREQVWGDDRHCERCGTPVIKKNLEQWFFRITKYAEELLDFSNADWPERVKIMQTNWVGRSEGAEVVFRAESEDPLPVFTTRPDTLWGATFMVLAPEHPLVEKITPPDYHDAVYDYQEQAARASDIEREAVGRDKTGVFTGAYAINPVNGERIPIWIADYVLMTYGSGAIMGVPSHDERDYEFALKFGLSIIPVIEPLHGKASSIVSKDAVKKGFTAALEKAGIAFEETDGWYDVALNDRTQADQYVEIAQAHVKKGSYVPVAGVRFSFVFDDAVFDLDSMASDRAIVERVGGDGKIAMEILEADAGFKREDLFHTAYHTMVNSGDFTGTPGDKAVADVTKWLEKQGIGKHEIQYRLHDWLISRQRMWGAPIPMVYCDSCGVVPVPEDQLPVLLPDDVEFDEENRENPLTRHEGFLNTTCPICDEPAKRETDTMDTFMCSSWYQYRYLSPEYDAHPFDPVEGAYWLPVDQYTGGIEHATMHLLYTRFFTKAMRDCSLFDGVETPKDISREAFTGEPMAALYNQGIVLGEDGEKMSKSRGNVIAPDDLVEKYGTDAVRGYMMFAFKWDRGGPWMSKDIIGLVRFLNDVWKVVEPPPKKPTKADAGDAATLRRKLHQTIRRVTDGLEDFRFNTALAAIMELKNLMAEMKSRLAGTDVWVESQESLLLLLAPFTPHITEELWERIGGPYSIHQQSWPEFDAELAAEEQITLIIQVNGKVRDRIEVAADIDEEEAKALALASEKVQSFLNGGQPRQIIYVPGRLINVVV
jgi:leucyl-tRNA synthetase